MQSKPKTNSVITSRYDEQRNVLVFTVLDQGDVELDLSKVSEANSKRAEIHGWNQRIPDAAAISATDASGQIIPRAERARIKFERMNDLCRFYESGTEEWSRKGEGGGGRSLIVEAIARVKQVDYVAAEEMVQRHSDTVCKGDRKKALVQLAKSKRVQDAMNEIRAERAGPVSEDADSLLDSLE